MRPPRTAGPDVTEDALGTRSGAAAGPAPVGADVTDAELVARLAGRDTGALDLLYGRHGRAAYSLARRICADETLAEDVVQEVFLVLWRDPERFDRTRGTVISWLLTLVHHKSVDAVRREATRRRHHVATEEPEVTSGPEGAVPSADRAALGSVIAEHVRAALRHLPSEQRQALGLAYYGGYTQREVASITGVPIGTVKSRMFTGVAKLRVLLAPVLGTSALDLLGDTW
ncbi:RNA polymerase sigma factor [Actinomycetospora termitidis]|uniref:Sigma-70 family RNA polymerase sigma factor n=1 Tax=Actinomycetospora termitidis TaxID=3053470 RepID=A0ABT7M1M9_9PSEU|nr:sigma-70 family RNA polymerase sigma factor [Actinomycetospora sp. Odt1-22]MDL5154551.1 sigma-70 family RNA polymerase sigma factor [Actinomycetospora sp. Odt1-22]